MIAYLGLYLPMLVLAVAVLLAIGYAFVLIMSKLHSVQKELRSEIRDSVKEKFIKVAPETHSLIDLSVELWRLNKKLTKSLAVLSEDQKKAIEVSMSKIGRFLEKNDIEVRDYTNQNYNEGMNVDILSTEKDSTLAQSIVKDTVEPAVMHKGQIIKKAKVIILEK